MRKNNQTGRILIKCSSDAKVNNFLWRTAQMCRYFLTTCTNKVHEDKNIKQMSYYTQETGRSMVEMLGVLAIIGVLSVGAIAGYSKAMFKYKMNKHTQQISFILDYLIANKEQLFKAGYHLNPILTKLEIIPQEMKIEDIYVYDSFNSRIKLENHRITSPNSGMAFGYEISDNNQSVEICRNFITISKERADDISWIYIQRGKADSSSPDNIEQYYGNNAKNKNNYLRNLDINQMDNICRSCEETTYCTIFALIGYKT